MFGLCWAKSTGERFLRERAAIVQGLRIKIYEDWQPELDEVLEYLPEADILPHELFRLLMKLPNPGRKQIILVTERGEPVALAGVRNRWGFWEPVTQWIVPGVLFPVKEGRLSRVLPALGLHLYVGWWRWPGPPPMTKWTGRVESHPAYGMSCSEDFEVHWRKSSLLKNIRTTGNRCRGFELKVNKANSTEWIIRNWDQKWRGAQGIGQGPDVTEKLLTAEYLQKKGLYYSLLLLDRDEPVAGGTYLIHRNEVVAHCSYRNPKYDWHGGMNRLLEMQFFWARDMGFDGIDLGGTFDYKKRWAPERGQYMIFTVCPDNILVGDRVSKLIGTVRRKCSNGSSKLETTQSPAP
jgi:hypothetical protein